MKDYLFTITLLLIILGNNMPLIIGRNSLPLDQEKTYFTPHGILQNPYHVWPGSPSGVLRSRPAMGFEWVVGWGWNFIINPTYVATLNVGVNVNGHGFYKVKDFTDNGINLYSRYHTKNLISYDWEYAGLRFSFKFFLAGENSIACLAEIENLNDEERTLSLYPVGRLFLPRPLIVRGYIVRRAQAPVYIVLLSRALNLTVVLGGNGTSVSQGLAYYEREVENWIKKDDIPGHGDGKSLFSLFTVHGSLKYELKIPPRSKRRTLLIMSRGNTHEAALEAMQHCLKDVDNILRRKMEEDKRFWLKAPKLIGDWPEHWINGFIYDLETLRTVIYPPTGVFKHRWDIMHVNWPRNVIAETSIDMLILSYVDEEISKEVLLGLFKDALAPNVPCVHADGTYNMVAMDGSRCGTSPAWCLPFYAYSIIYSRTRDVKWLREIYPYWSRYLRWWLKNRVDKDGWLHYKCSWESGEDLAPRFGPQTSGGQLIEHIRASELHAVMAHAAKTMAFYARELSLGINEIKYWENVYETYSRKLQEMWFNGWFHDYDVRAGRFTRYKDPLHLSPAFLGLASKDQVAEMLRDTDRLLLEFVKSVGVETLEWPCLTFPYMEALWVAGEFEVSKRETMLEQLYELIDRVYSMMDMRVWKRNYPLPGVSYENWAPPGVPRVEGYGWGALLSLLVIRYLIGFREIELTNETAFLLSPGFPEGLAQTGRSYGIKGLRFRDVILDILYRVESRDILNISIIYASDKNYIMRVLDRDGKIIYKSTEPRREAKLNFRALNKMTYKIELLSLDRGESG